MIKKLETITASHKKVVVGSIDAQTINHAVAS